MSRHSTEFQALEHQVGSLLSAIESGHKGRDRRGPKQAGSRAHVQSAALYVALSDALGSAAVESLRQDFHKYRLGRAVKGGRVPSAEKVVRLVDAASKLGWIDRKASGSGAEELVAWCRDECQRVERDAVERKRRREAMRRAQASTDAERVVDDALGVLAGAELVASANEILAITLRRVQRHLLRSELARQPDGSFLHDDIAQTNVDFAVSEILTTLSNEVQMWPGPEARATEGLLAALEAERELVNLSLPTNRSALEKEALEQLGIGRPQLERILKSLHSGAGLLREDAKAREKLLALYCGFRNVAKWTRARDSFVQSRHS
jgi:hypothetical protein